MFDSLESLFHVQNSSDGDADILFLEGKKNIKVHFLKNDFAIEYLLQFCLKCQEIRLLTGTFDQIEDTMVCLLSCGLSRDLDTYYAPSSFTSSAWRCQVFCKCQSIWRVKQKCKRKTKISVLIKTVSTKYCTCIRLIISM